jgi:hypothetical protein
MTARPLALSCLLLLAAVTLVGAATPATSPAKPAPSAAFLPDSFVLARVQNRSIRVDRFVDAYFASYAPVRPKPDSLGRVEFLTSMVNKEVLALTALSVNRPFGFEDRATMREHTERVLSNALYQRFVLDSVVVTDDEVRRSYTQYGREQRFRRIRFDDPEAAAAVRAGLTSKSLSWDQAARRASGSTADTGWVARTSVDPVTAQAVWDLQPGEVSDVVAAPDGFYLCQVVQSRKVDPPAFEPLRPMLAGDLRDLRASQRAWVLRSRSEAGSGWSTTPPTSAGRPPGSTACRR